MIERTNPWDQTPTASLAHMIQTFEMRLVKGQEIINDASEQLCYLRAVKRSRESSAETKEGSQ